MEDITRNDIRKLLKLFGIQADEAITSHVATLDGSQSLRLRITLEDVSDYGDHPPAHPLRLEVDGEVRAGQL